MGNVMEGLLEEMERVQSLKKIYDDLPMNAGMFGSMLMKQALDEGKKAIAENDVVGIVSAYAKLKEFNE